MNALLAIPLTARLAVLIVLGTCAAAVVNRAVYALAWNQRDFSPWSRRHPRDARNRWLDRLPLVGWWRLRRKSDVLGRGFWLRPLVVELACGAGCAWLYWWEVHRGGLLPGGLPWGPPGAALLIGLHWQWLAHVLLMLAMLTASLIDLDEQAIPDEITVPGTLLGLALAACVPAVLLPGRFNQLGEIIPVHLAFPSQWPQELAAWPNVNSLLLGLGCYWLWCVALLPRPWRTRHGLGRAMRILSARLWRSPFTRLVLLMAVVGAVGIAAVWRWGALHWLALLSSLVGMTVGGLLIWLTRVIGRWALRREAMGFGDVTLLAMIGAFIGWQAVLLVFFFAPFAGLVVGLLQWISHREHVLPYGPWLCLAAGVVVVFWPSVWQAVEQYFFVPWLLPAVVGLCMVLMAVLLGAWMLVKRVLFGGG